MLLCCQVRSISKKFFLNWQQIIQLHLQLALHSYYRDEFDDDDGSGSEDENRPLTKEELLEKALRSVRKRENTTKKQGFQYELSESHEKTKKKDKHAKSTKVLVKV